MKKLNLEILTPFGNYFSGSVDALLFHSEDFYSEILPSHSPLISSVSISKLTIKNDGHFSIFAISGGVIRVQKDKTTLLVNSIESKDEIDIERAHKAKARAEKLLKNKAEIDVIRAELALKRALNRINVYNS